MVLSGRSISGKLCHALYLREWHRCSLRAQPSGPGSGNEAPLPQPHAAGALLEITGGESCAGGYDMIQKINAIMVAIAGITNAISTIIPSASK